jgi:hypothetical protein
MIAPELHCYSKNNKNDIFYVLYDMYNGPRKLYSINIAFVLLQVTRATPLPVRHLVLKCPCLLSRGAGNFPFPVALRWPVPVIAHVVLLYGICMYYTIIRCMYVYTVQVLYIYIYNTVQYSTVVPFPKPCKKGVGKSP